VIPEKETVPPKGTEKKRQAGFKDAPPYKIRPPTSPSTKSKQHAETGEDPDPRKLRGNAGYVEKKRDDDRQNRLPSGNLGGRHGDQHRLVHCLVTREGDNHGG